MGVRGTHTPCAFPRLRAVRAARFSAARAKSLTSASLGASPRARPQVHGKPPVFVVPEAKKRIDDRMHPELERKMLASKLAGQTQNYVRKNMKQAK